jgi:hypothetical protein
MTALDEQVGGSHYKDFAIQPVEFIHKNKIGFIEGNIVKYICRYESKGGIEDLKKVKHYVELLIELSKNKSHENIAVVDAAMPLTMLDKEKVISELEKIISHEDFYNTKNYSWSITDKCQPLTKNIEHFMHLLATTGFFESIYFIDKETCKIK